MPGATTAPVSSDPLSRPPGAIGQVHTLVIAWSAEEPGRVGEIAVLPRREAQVLGRGDDEPDEPRVRFFRQRPGVFAPTPPLASAGLSRRQLSLTVQDDGLAVERIGRCPLKVNGAACDGALMKLGDTLHLTRQLVLVFGRRVAVSSAAPVLPVVVVGGVRRGWARSGSSASRRRPGSSESRSR